MAPYVYPSINLLPLDQLDGMVIAFFTRRMTVLPLVSGLSPQQAGSSVMLGESVQTTAGDPRRSEESLGVVGTNPFIELGPRGRRPTGCTSIGTEVPEKVDGPEVSNFDVCRQYTPEQTEGYAGRLREERREYLAGFPGLHEEAVKAYD